jgi:outer membrane protein TolC
MRWKATAVLVGVIAGTVPAAADPLTLDGAVKLALEKNLSLQRSAIELLGKKRTSDNAWGLLVPSTSFSTGVSRPNNAYSTTGASVDPTWSQTATAGVSLSLPASLFTNLAQAQLAYQSGSLTYDTARRSLEKSVRLAFGSLLLEEENLTLSEQNVGRKQTAYNDTQTKYKSGLASDLDVLSAQVALETLKPSLQRLRATYLNDLGQFKVLLGIPTSQDVTLTGSLDQEIEKNLQIDAIAQGAADSPDVRAAQLSLRSAELSLDATKLSSWLPTASLSWTTQPARSLTSGSKWTDSTGALSLSLSYSLDSFFWWTTESSSVASAEDTVKTSRSQLDETRTNSALTRENDVRLIRQAVESLATQRLNLALAQKTYDLTRDAYQRGTKDLLTLQNSEGDLNQAHYDLLSQRYSLISAVIDLEYELNLPFGTLWGGKQ